MNPEINVDAEETIVTPKASLKEKPLLSKEASKIVQAEVSSIISQKLSQLQVELLSSVKEMLFQYSENSKKKSKKTSVVRKPPVMVSMDKIKDSFKSKYLTNISKSSITLSYLLSTMQNTCFDEDVIRNIPEVFEALCLNPMEKSILEKVFKEGNEDKLQLLINFDDKNYLVNKLVDENFIIEVEDVEYDISEKDIVDKLVKNNLIVPNESDSYKIKTSFTDAFTKAFKKKITDPLNCSASKLAEFFKSVTQRNVSIYCCINHDHVEILDKYEIPYIKVKKDVYTKSALIKAAFTKRLVGKPSKFSTEDYNYLETLLFKWFSVNDGINVDNVINMMKQKQV